MAGRLSKNSKIHLIEFSPETQKDPEASETQRLSRIICNPLTSMKRLNCFSKSSSSTSTIGTSSSSIGDITFTNFGGPTSSSCELDDSHSKRYSKLLLAGLSHDEDVSASSKYTQSTALSGGSSIFPSAEAITRSKAATITTTPKPVIIAKEQEEEEETCSNDSVDIHPTRTSLSPKMPLARSLSEPFLVGRRKSCLKNNNDVSVSTSFLEKGTLKKKQRSVSFSTVRIRDYERTVGDNPAVSSGSPISIGWEWLFEHEETVEQYESHRCNARRSKEEMKIPSDVRDEILIEEWEIPKACVRHAKTQAREDKQKRIDSYHYRHAEKLQILSEITSKKIKYIISGKSSRKQKKELWANATKTHV